MAICKIRTSIAALAFLAVVVGACTPASAAPPNDPCNTEPPAAPVADALLQITPHSLQPQQNWQRQGRDIDITIRSALPKTGTARAFVCFRWKVAAGNTDAVGTYRNFVEAASTGTAIALGNLSGPMKFVATVPTSLPAAPLSPRAPEGNKAIGVYGKNNAYPIAEVRVMVYVDDGAKPALDLRSTVGVIGADTYCDMPLTDTTVDSGVGEVGEHKNWQPIGGLFEFAVKSSKVIPTNALVKVCFRWKLTDGDPGPFYESGPTHMIDKQTQSIKVAASVLGIPNKPSWWSSTVARHAAEPRIGSFAIPVVGLVPQADARILIIDSDGSPIADVLTTVGITNLYFAFIIVVLTIAIAFAILWRTGRNRLARVPKCGPLLRIITTRDGYASLSQFQIILWTFVVIASAAYVMALSGDLIEITSGTLVLLGISGTATVIAKAKSEAEQKTAPPPLDPAQAAKAAAMAEDRAGRLEDAAKFAEPAAKDEADSAAKEARAIAEAAKAKAAAVAATAAAREKRAAVASAAADQKQAAETAAATAESDAQQKLQAAAVAAATADRMTRARHPRWSDLVMEEIQGQEIDVTRVQMLYFTLVTAVFVLLKVITSYEIPVIPDGFLVLMGISNSVYVGSKFAGGSGAG